ncbi:hypothetical protein HNY73_007283 [Argiope bruennichi]|uniref:Uncharacterized protein n=1 Tax=Argiope bruennichi TaxID=94029 RepID=A0A8T0FG36_ARGBR|nr:hypothetical protein HNY73_007283 [Argiope bruennichi]
MATSFQNYEAACHHLYQKYDIANVKNVELQTEFSSYDKHGFVNYLVDENTARENSKKQKGLSRESVPAEILTDLEKLKICKNRNTQSDNLEKSLQTNTPLQVTEKSEFSQELAQAIHSNNAENVLKEFFDQKLDYATEKTWRNNCLEDDYYLEILHSVFDFRCKMKDDVSTYFEKSNLSISAPNVETGDIHSESRYVPIIRNLLGFLSDIQRDLQKKEDNAEELKFRFEANLKELDLFCVMDNNKEQVRNKYRSLQKTANSLMYSAEKLLDNIKKERAECDWYCENLQHMLNSFQQNFS